MNDVNWFSGFLPKDLTARKKLKRTIWWAVAVILVLQLYFVRELIAAELLFGLGFAVFFMIALVIYALGSAGEKGIDLAGPIVERVGVAAKRGFSASVNASERGIEWATPRLKKYAKETAEWSSRVWAEMGRIAERGVKAAGPLATDSSSKMGEWLRRGWAALVRGAAHGIEFLTPYAKKLGPLARASWNGLSQGAARGWQMAGRGIEAATPYVKRYANVSAEWAKRAWVGMVKGAERGIELAGPVARKWADRASELAVIYARKMIELGRRGWNALDALRERLLRQRSESTR
jgi:hypothetical protein